MMHEKFENMELLRNSNVILDKIADDLICIYCKKILINAHQAPCGCKFCRKCIDTIIKAGNEFCPGNTEDCKENGFLKEINLSVDYRTNNIIFKLKVKCPNSNCNYECEFKNMDDHFNLCNKLIDCKSRNGVNNEANSDYIELSILVNKLLESVNELAHQEDNNKSEIHKLKEVSEEFRLNQNSSLIELIQNEINKSKKSIDKININGKDTLKLSENGDHENICLELKRELRKRESEIVSVKQEIDVIKMAYSDDFKRQMEVHFEEKLSGFITEMRAVFEMELGRVRGEHSGLHVSPISELATETQQPIIGNGAIVDPYVWRISEFSTKNKEVDNSLDFFTQDKCYLVRMVLNRGMIGTEFYIDLVLVDEGCEPNDGFPMNRQVRINILNQTTNVPFVGFTKTCSMNKGDTDNIARCSFAELPLDAVLKDDSIILECII